MSNNYENGYVHGYDTGWEAGFDSAKEECYDEFVKDYNLKLPGQPHNLCLKCDCMKFGFDCVLEDPKRYMENKLSYKEQPKRSLKKVVNSAYDRAMEIFIP